MVHCYTFKWAKVEETLIWCARKHYDQCRKINNKKLVLRVLIFNNTNYIRKYVTGLYRLGHDFITLHGIIQVLICITVYWEKQTGIREQVHNFHNIQQWLVAKQFSRRCRKESGTNLQINVCNQESNFLISQPKRMLWVLKRTVSIRGFFWALQTNV